MISGVLGEERGGWINRSHPLLFAAVSVSLLQLEHCYDRKFVELPSTIVFHHRARRMRTGLVEAGQNTKTRIARVPESTKNRSIFKYFIVKCACLKLTFTFVKDFVTNIFFTFLANWLDRSSRIWYDRKNRTRMKQKYTKLSRKARDIVTSRRRARREASRSDGSGEVGAPADRWRLRFKPPSSKR